MAMTVLNIPEQMTEGIFRLVSAVLYIGQLQFTDLEESVGLTSADRDVCARVAKLLRVRSSARCFVGIHPRHMGLAF